MNWYWIKTYLRWGFKSLNQALKNKRALRSDTLTIVSHVGLGDQILLSGLINSFIAENKKVTWLVRKSNLETVMKLTHSHPNLGFIILDDFDTSETARTKAIAHSKIKGIPTLFIGFELVWIAEKLFPARGLDEIFYKIARVSFEVSQLNSLRLEKFLAPPLQEYALVDNFPNTNREIPRSVFQSIENRGLKIIDNPRDIPILELMEVIRNAKEIHVVNSALLCLIISMRNQVNNVSIYLMGPKILRGKFEYPLSWSEFSLTDSSGKPLVNPIHLDRNAELLGLLTNERKFYRRLIAWVIF
jgi:hypothetical protein